MVSRYFSFENFKINKLLLRGLGTYMLFAAIIASFIIPVYMQSYNAVKNGIASDAKHNIEKGLKLIQNEIDTYYVIVNELTSNRDYKRARGSDGISAPEEYFYLASLQDYYRGLILSSVIQENSFIIFSENDIILSKYAVYDNAQKFYGKVWEYEGYTYEQIKNVMFSRQYAGEFLPSIRYRNIASGLYSDMTFVYTVSGNGQNGSVALFAIYDTDKLIKLLGLEEIAESGYVRILNNSGQESFKTSGDPKYLERKPGIVCVSENSSIAVEAYIPDSFYRSRMKNVHITLVLYTVLFALISVFLSLLFSYKSGKPLKGLIDYLSVSTEESYTVGDEYNYIRKQVSTLVSDRNLTKAQLLDKLFLKLLIVGLNAKETEELKTLHGSFPDVCCIAVLQRGKGSGDWDGALEAELSFRRLFPFWRASVRNGLKVLFFEGEGIPAGTFKTVITHLNGKNGMNVRGALGSPCASAAEVTDSFSILCQAIKYLESGMMLTFDNIRTESADNNPIGEYYINSKSFYELLRSGNASESSREVYAQWYQLSQNPGDGSDIIDLFYYQLGILTQVSLDVGFVGDLPVFDNNNGVLENAIEMTRYIEQLCAFIEMNKNNDNKRSVDVLNHINEQCFNPSFYMGTLSEKFSLSSKTLNQIIKNMTGTTFLLYVSRLRFERAEHLLKDTSIPIADVAAQSGFDSQNSFFKKFKKEYGVSPTVYRNSRQN